MHVLSNFKMNLDDYFNLQKYTSEKHQQFSTQQELNSSSYKSTSRIFYIYTILQQLHESRVGGDKEIKKQSF